MLMQIQLRRPSARLALAGLCLTLALITAAFAQAANKPTTVEAGNLLFTFNGGFSPTKLPKKKLAPISLSASGSIKTKDGSHVPALREVEIETDRNGEVNVIGLPVCTAGKLQSRDTAAAEKACKRAIIGKGETEVEVALPEQRPIPVESKLIAFNGGTRNGTTTFYIHAFFSAPVTGAIVTTVKIKKIHKGRYGLLSIASIPKIAGGSGSVKSFNLVINRRYTYKGRKLSVLTARCADGKLQAHANAVFADGTQAGAEIIRTCTPTG